LTRLQIVNGDKFVIGQFVASIPPFEGRGWGEFAAIGYVWDGQLIGGSIFHNWDPSAGVIEISTGTTDPRWLCRKSILAMFGFPFNQLGCQMVVLRVAESNEHMRDIAKRFGFDEHVIPRLWGRNEAGYIYTLTVEQWRARGFERLN
jgi:RimJ/RimL family protein N-acetyltransferase